MDSQDDPVAALLDQLEVQTRPLQHLLLAAALVGLALGWVLRVPTKPVPEVVVRLVRTPPQVVERSDPVTAACLKQHQVALTLIGVTASEPSTETSCREQIALAVAVTTERQLDQTGRPLHSLRICRRSTASKRSRPWLSRLWRRAPISG